MAEKIGQWKKNNAGEDARATYNMSVQKNMAPASKRMEYKWWKTQRGATALSQQAAMLIFLLTTFSRLTTFFLCGIPNSMEFRNRVFAKTWIWLSNLRLFIYLKRQIFDLEMCLRRRKFEFWFLSRETPHGFACLSQPFAFFLEWRTTVTVMMLLLQRNNFLGNNTTKIFSLLM